MGESCNEEGGCWGRGGPGAKVIAEGRRYFVRTWVTSRMLSVLLSSSSLLLLLLLLLLSTSRIFELFCDIFWRISTKPIELWRQQTTPDKDQWASIVFIKIMAFYLPCRTELCWWLRCKFIGAFFALYNVIIGCWNAFIWGLWTFWVNLSNMETAFKLRKFLTPDTPTRTGKTAHANGIAQVKNCDLYSLLQLRVVVMMSELSKLA